MAYYPIRPNKTTSGIICWVRNQEYLLSNYQFYKWDRTKDPRPITIQTIDKTIVKTGGVVRNWEFEMGYCYLANKFMCGMEKMKWMFCY